MVTRANCNTIYCTLSAYDSVVAVSGSRVVDRSSSSSFTSVWTAMSSCWSSGAPDPSQAVTLTWSEVVDLLLPEDSESEGAAFFFWGRRLAGLFPLVGVTFLIFLAGFFFFLIGADFVDAPEEESDSDEELFFAAGKAFFPHKLFQKEPLDVPALAVAADFFGLAVFFLGVLRAGDSVDDDRLAGFFLMMTGGVAGLTGVLGLLALLLCALSGEESSLEDVEESSLPAVFLTFPAAFFFLAVFTGGFSAWGRFQRRLSSTPADFFWLDFGFRVGPAFRFVLGFLLAARFWSEEDWSEVDVSSDELDEVAEVGERAFLFLAGLLLRPMFQSFPLLSCTKKIGKN